MNYLEVTRKLKRIL